MDKAEFCSIVFCYYWDCTINTCSWQMWTPLFEYLSFSSNMLISGFASFWYICKLWSWYVYAEAITIVFLLQGLTIIYFCLRGHTILSICSRKNEFLQFPWHEKYGFRHFNYFSISDRNNEMTLFDFHQNRCQPSWIFVNWGYLLQRTQCQVDSIVCHIYIQPFSVTLTNSLAQWKSTACSQVTLAMALWYQGIK